MKRTFQPKKRHRATKHGFLARSKSSNGRKVLAGMRKKENGAPCGAAVKQGHWQVAFLRIP